MLYSLNWDFISFSFTAWYLTGAVHIQNFEVRLMLFFRSFNGRDFVNILNVCVYVSNLMANEENTVDE